MEGTLSVPLETYQAAVSQLASAERNRRAGDGTLPNPGLPVNADYAACASLIERAMHHLDESLPNAQLERSLSAYLALEYGTRALGRWMDCAIAIRMQKESEKGFS